jgi:hypothetical protein
MFIPNIISLILYEISMQIEGEKTFGLLDIVTNILTDGSLSMTSLTQQQTS